MENRVEKNYKVLFHALKSSYKSVPVEYWYLGISLLYSDVSSEILNQLTN